MPDNDIDMYCTDGDVISMICKDIVPVDKR